MKKRSKINLPALTRADAELLVTEYAQTKLNHIRLTAAMDAALTSVREKFAPAIAECEQSLKQKTETLCHWAQNNPCEFPKGRKSIQFPTGSIGFRTGTPKLALLNRAWTWEGVFKALIALGLAKFIRTKEEVDKDAIIAGASPVQCAEFGTRVVQDESFFVDPVLTEVQTRQTAEVA